MDVILLKFVNKIVKLFFVSLQITLDIQHKE
jgi:hypothetical protein